MTKTATLVDPSYKADIDTYAVNLEPGAPHCTISWTGHEKGS